MKNETNKIIISPSILSSDFAKLGEEIKMLENCGADWIHVDVMDGHFVPNLTIGAPVVKSLKKTANIPLDVHLMIDNPLNYIKDFALAGADIITFHLEAAYDICNEIIDVIHSFNIKAGISIKPNTKPSEIFKYINNIDLILIMSVEPGFGGQKFMPHCADKIKEFLPLVKPNTIIQVDGGINDKTAKYCTNLGANALVAGNYIFSSEDRKKAIELLRL